MARYDRYDGWRGGFYPGWYPGAYWAGAPMFGWADWGMWPAYGPPGFVPYGRDFVTPRRPPRESPAYGRGGDRAVRRWAREHGYDEGYEIPPHWDRPRRAPRRYPW